MVWLLRTGGASCDLSILGRPHRRNGSRAHSVPGHDGSVEPVEITAGRLHLRPWRAGDADSLERVLADPAVARWTGLPTRPAREWVTVTYPGRWADGTGAAFAVLDATTAELLGRCRPARPRGRRRGRGRVVHRAGRPGRRRRDGGGPGAVPVGLRRRRPAPPERAGRGGQLGVARAGREGGLRRRGGLARRARPGDRRADAWLASLLATDEVRDRRAFAPLGGRTDGVVALRPRRAGRARVARACDDAESARWLPLPVPYTEQDARAWALGLVPRVGRRAGRERRVVDAGSDELLGAVASRPGATAPARSATGRRRGRAAGASPSARRGCTPPGPSTRSASPGSSCSPTCATPPRSAWRRRPASCARASPAPCAPSHAAPPASTWSSGPTCPEAGGGTAAGTSSVR